MRNVIDDALRNLVVVLKHVRPRGVLLNGNVEMFLKAVFASHFDALEGGRWRYVMDKNFGSQIDLLLLLDRAPRCAIEFKSTLLEDGTGSMHAAERAVAQAQVSADLSRSNREQFGQCESYVIHFLSTHYPKGELPDFIYRRFERLRNGVGPEQIFDLYSNILTPGNCTLVTLVEDDQDLPGVRLYAVVAKVEGTAQQSGPKS